MLDILITGGTVVDGTGAPQRKVDVGVEGDRIVSLTVPGSGVNAHRIIDAEGMAVTPGFVDVHTHVDAQVFWDPTLDPLPLYGTTSTVAGNCGFTLAPALEKDVDYVTRMLSKVEDIPLESLRAGVPWNWSSTAEYLDRVEDCQPAINLGFMVGHSTLRRMVMGHRSGSTPTEDDISRMCLVLVESLRGGGLGFSTSDHGGQVDGDGDPIPSRSATREELVALCAATGEVEGTTLQLATNGRLAHRFDDERIKLLTEMSASANRSINWNVFVPLSVDAEETRSQLAASDKVAQGGGRMYALAYPGVMSQRKLLFGLRYAIVPGWSEFVEASAGERVARLADPVERARLRDLADAAREAGSDERFQLTYWDKLILAECFTPETRGYEGCRVGDIAQQEGRDPFDVVCDVAVADHMRTWCISPERAADEVSWQMRSDSWQDPRVILGASDSGAHVQSMATFDWATGFLSENRERRVLSIEQAVQKVTQIPALLYGLRDRGQISVGAYADILIFDPDSIGPGRVQSKTDLPGGAVRLSGNAVGIRSVLVNGKEVVRDGAMTGIRPGKVLRSGVDTATVGVDG